MLELLLRKRFFFLLLPLWLSARIFPLPEPMSTPPPYSADAAREIPIFLLHHPEPMSAEDAYELGLLYMLAGQAEEAERYLDLAIAKDPEFSYALIQVGYLNYWTHDYVEAYEAFWKAFQIDPCGKQSFHGLEMVGTYWLHENEHIPECLQLFKALYECSPKNIDIVFYTGLAYMRLNQVDEAKKKFIRCLELRHNDPEASFQLAQIYMMEGNWEEAEKLYRKAGPTAKKHLARALVRQRKFVDAKEEFSLFLTENPSDMPTWYELREVKSYVDPTLLLSSTYTEAKESDPTIAVPVVKDYYLYIEGTLNIPITLAWDINAQGFYYQQKEKNIYIPGTNYNVQEEGGAFLSSLDFAKCWTWDLILRLFHASPIGDMSFPFSSTNRFEPGTALIYRYAPHLICGEVRVESFFTKNFTYTETDLLQILTGELRYLFRPDVNLHPELEASLRKIYFDDSIHNWQTTESLWLRSHIPYLSKYFRGEYQFQHSHFHELTTNYFSYQDQFVNKVGIYLAIPLQPATTFGVHYEHVWQLTKHFIQPIGTFLFTANRQSLNGNLIIANITHALQDLWEVKLEGHYFHNNLPYSDWNINGSFLYQF